MTTVPISGATRQVVESVGVEVVNYEGVLKRDLREDGNDHAKRGEEMIHGDEPAYM